MILNPFSFFADVFIISLLKENDEYDVFSSIHFTLIVVILPVLEDTFCDKLCISLCTLIHDIDLNRCNP